MSINNSFKSTVQYDNDVILYNLDHDKLYDYPLKVSMKSLELLQKNIHNQGYYFKFSDNIQEFINNHKKEYKSLIKNEVSDFNDFSQLYFQHMSGPLYKHADSVFSFVNRIYELETYFDKINSFDNIPNIPWKIKNDVHDLSIEIDNIDNLTNQFGKAVVLHSLLLFKDHLNYEHQITNKTHNKPYKISNKLLPSFFNKKINSHELLESFHGKDYFLTQFLDTQMKTVSSLEDILKFVLIRENIKALIQPQVITNDHFKTNSKLKIK